MGGLAAGWSVSPRKDRTTAWLLGGLGAAADLDLLVGAHRGAAHSIGFAVAVGLAASAITRRRRWGAAAGLAWASHVLLDWMSEDTWPPIGIQALWPLSPRWFQAPVVIFPSVSRQYWRPDFWSFNLTAATVELLILLPIAAAVIYASGGSPFRSCPPPGATPPRA